MAFLQWPMISSAVPSHRRLDILVEAEQVRWVVLVLQLDQASVVGPIGIPDPLGPVIIAQVIHVHTVRQMRPYRVEELARPADVTVRVCRIDRTA